MPQPRMNIQKLIDSSTDEEEKELLKVFPEIIKTLRDLLQIEDDELLPAQNHFQELMEHNMLHRKNCRALMLMKAYRAMAGDASDEDLKVVRVIAWCYEINLWTSKLSDEIIFDRAVNEEGHPCYHRVMDNGFAVSNDVYYLDCSLYVLLQTFIQDRTKLMSIEPMFRHAIKQTFIGQNILQNTFSPRGEIDFSLFTSDRYNSYVKYRTAFSTFFFPVKFAMTWTGINDSQGLQQVEDVTLKMGHFAQVKEDYLNCYGSEEIFGKSGSNIALSKICWLFVSALSAANSEQKEILTANYGQLDKSCIDKVSAVYDDLDLKGSFRKYEKTIHRDLMTEISKMRDDLPKQLLLDTTNRILNWENTLNF